MVSSDPHKSSLTSDIRVSGVERIALPADPLVPDRAAEDSSPGSTPTTIAADEQEREPAGPPEGGQYA
jgi:hypothetical protein